mgnify:CR=1 FL=1
MDCSGVCFGAGNDCNQDGIDDLAARKRLLNDFNLEIGAGLGVLAGKIWRIGLMGQSSNKKNIEHCLDSIKQVI